MRPLPVLMHVPRSGGTYISSRILHIGRHQDPYNSNLYYETGNDAMYRFLTNDASSDQTYFHVVESSGFKGHKEYLSDLYPNQEFKYYMILRNPLDRLYSLYNYLKSSKSHHEKTHKAISYETFDDWIINGNGADFNWIIKHINSLPNGTKVEQKHYFKAFHEIKKMNIYDMSNIEECIKDICHTCGFKYLNKIPTNPYAINDSGVTEKINFSTTSKEFQSHFIKKVFWEITLYANYFATNRNNFRKI